MNRLATVQGLKRIVATNPSAADRMERGEQETYVQEVERALGWLTDDQWGKVVDWAVANRKHRSLPSIAEWREIVSSVRKAGGIPSLGDCQSCGSTTWVSGIYRIVKTGEYIEAVQVCGQCSKRNSLPQRPDLEFVCVPSQEVLIAIRMSPMAARMALKNLEATPRAKLNETAHLILIQRANEEPVRGEAPCKRIADVIDGLMSQVTATPARPRGRSETRQVEV